MNVSKNLSRGEGRMVTGRVYPLTFLFRPRQTRQIEELRKKVDQCCHSISRIESKLTDLQKALQESENGSEMMMQVAQAASVAVNSIIGTTVPSNATE